MSNSCQNPRAHLHQAHEHLRGAARAWAEQAVPPAARDHLADAARHLLQAGIAAVDAAQERDRARRGQPASAPPAPAAPPA